jgi:hypothetical protein
MNKIATYLKCVLLVALFIVATQPFFLTAQDDSNLAQWTFMVYIAADNNLETFALRDMAEMEFNGSTDEINIVVQLDRADGYSREDRDWTGARRYYVTKGKGLGITSEVVEDLGNVNMADAKTLADFGTWAMTTYPAERYALILWDHGGSWVGFAEDASAGHDLMTMLELDTALAEITRATGVEKLDIIGFDACLMGGYEVYLTLQPYAHYAIASETLIPGLGWDYDFTLLDLIENPKMDALEFGKKIVDNFITFYANQSRYAHYSLSLIDMNAMGQLGAILPSFVNVMNAETTAPESVTLARNATLRFGSVSGDFTRDFNSTLGLIDMFGFVENIKLYTEDTNLINAAQQMLDVRDSVVVYHQSSESLQRSNGMSVYFPTNRIRPQPDDNTIRYGINSEDPWAQAILEFYTNIALYGTEPRAQFGATEVGANGVNVPLDSANFEVMQQAVFTLWNNDTIVNYEVFDPSQPIVWQPEGTVFKYGDSAESVMVFRSADYPDAYAVRGMISNELGDNFDVEWYFDNDTGEPQVMWALTPNETGTVAYSEYKPYSGDNLQLYTYSMEGTDVTVDVSPISYAVGDTDTEAFEVAPVTDTNGEYTVVVVLSVVTGQTVATEFEVEVQDGQFNVVSEAVVVATEAPEPVILPTATLVPALPYGGTCNPDTANYCLPGQLWGDGRCDSADPNIAAYNYQLGWYRAAYECEVIDSYPEGFAPPSTPEPEPESTEEPCTSAHPMFPNC